ncbi:MAG: 30S ribosomal protein S9 [Chlamydiota bacterium]
MKKSSIKETIGVGRRKTAVASVRLRPGSGKIVVNGKPFVDYFKISSMQETLKSPLVHFSLENQYDVLVRVSGGGLEAQTIAVRLGVARALVAEKEELRKALKDLQYLTRDPRRKERKKYGLAGARKRYQFSKR